jgi:hypothetical protein
LEVANVESLTHKKSKSGGGAAGKALPPEEITDKDYIVILKNEIKVLKDEIKAVTVHKKTEYEAKRVFFFL